MQRQSACGSIGLIVIEKKSKNHLGGPRGRKITPEDKRCAIQLIKEAHRQGCRRQLACDVLGISLRTLQRWEKSIELADQRKGPHISPAHKLSEQERAKILSIANTKEYARLSPRQIVPKLADKGIYIASESSFYRVLKKHNQLKYRFRQRPPSHKKPASYSAKKSNQIWSWDISYLPTNVKGLFFYLYVFVDIFSRKIVGFDVFDTENAANAIIVLDTACEAEGIGKNKIVLHSDNGSPMKAYTWLAKLHQLGITPSYSRPSVSNDNPYSEALFKTVKYSRLYPREPFKKLTEARKWMADFVLWYNHEHLHSGLKFVTPFSQHQGDDAVIIDNRIEVYKKAQLANPARWSKGIRNWKMPNEVYLNPGKQIRMK